jgi:hypothetical protein
MAIVCEIYGHSMWQDDGFDCETHEVLPHVKQAGMVASEALTQPTDCGFFLLEIFMLCEKSATALPQLLQRNRR